MIKARPYQSQCVQKIWDNMKIKNDQLISLPTASGKTIIFTMLLDKILKVYPQLKAQILVNQVKLVKQTQEKLHLALEENHVGLFCGSLGDYNNDAAVTVGSVQSISKTTSFLNLLIIDEAHNADNSSTYNNYIERLIAENPKLKIVRFTATPFTTSGYIYGEGKPNKSIDFLRTMNQMISENYIVAPTFKGSDSAAFDTSTLRTRQGEFILRDVEKMSMDEKKVREQVADAIPKLVGRKKVVWSCTCIKHAELVQSIVKEYEPCVIIHSKLSPGEQKLNMNRFENNDVRHISSVTMVSEGYDFPAIDGIVAMRPTRSPVLYVQLCGRGLRLFPGKKDCLFLDYGEIVENLGHPNNPVVLKKTRNKNEKQAILCPACMELNFMPVKNCSDCGFEFYKEERGPRQVTKSLDRIAKEYNFNKNGKIELELAVLGVKIDKKYISKAGNQCWCVTYTTMQGQPKEYLKIGTSFHREFQRDFNLMGKPKLVIVEKHGKFLKVIKRSWT